MCLWCLALLALCLLLVVCFITAGNSVVTVRVIGRIKSIKAEELLKTLRYQILFCLRFCEANLKGIFQNIAIGIADKGNSTAGFNSIRWRYIDACRTDYLVKVLEGLLHAGSSPIAAACRSSDWL